MATQVKLYIEPEQEIRRFSLEANATFEQLRQRVEALVGHGNFRILWLDSEKDFVVLGSADELVAAKEAVTNGLLRLFVRPTAPAASTEKKKTHHGVTCDGCQGVLAGTRYKCLECVDYDLCEACQAKGIHAEHDMLAIRRPRTMEWKKLFMQGYGSRAGLTTDPAQLQEEGPCGFRRPCGGSARAPGHHHRHHPRGPGMMCGNGPFGPFAGPFGNGGPFGPHAGGPFGGPFAGGFVPPMCRPHHRHHTGAAKPAEKPAEQTVEMDLDMNRPVSDLISEISQAVMGALHKAQTGPQPAATGQETSSESPKTQEEKKVEQEASDVVNAAFAAVAEVADAVSEFVEELKAESEHEWTHLEAEKEEKKPEAAEKSEQPTDEKTVKDQRIESALRAMEEMGFPSEGVLLRRLLENYNGDIARVLDSIK